MMENVSLIIIKDS